MKELEKDTLMTKNDVSEYLDCCKATVDKIFMLPDFPKIMIGKKKSYVKYEDLCNYLSMYRGKRIQVGGNE